MTHEFRIGGVLISTVVPAFLVALILMVLISRVLVRLGFYKLIWHRPLFDVALLLILFSAIILLFPMAGSAASEGS